MDTIAVPLSPDVRDALEARLAPTIGWSQARREVARAAAGQPSAHVEQAVGELWAELQPAVAAVKALWAATQPEESP